MGDIVVMFGVKLILDAVVTVGGPTDAKLLDFPYIYTWTLIYIHVGRHSRDNYF